MSNIEALFERPSVVAIIMSGGGIHGRMLVQELVCAGLAPDLIILEEGTTLATRIGLFLSNEIDNPPPLVELLRGTHTRLVRVDRFDGDVAISTLKETSPHFVLNGGAGIYRSDLLAIPRCYFLNAHPGLLPEFRGLDPVPWALLERRPIGATLHVVSEGVDEGDIVLRRELPWTGANSLLELRLQTMRLCAQLVVEYLANPLRWTPLPQDQGLAANRGPFPPERLAEAESNLSSYCLTSHGGNAFSK